MATIKHSVAHVHGINEAELSELGKHLPALTFESCGLQFLGADREGDTLSVELVERNERTETFYNDEKRRMDTRPHNVDKVKYFTIDLGLRLITSPNSLKDIDRFFRIIQQINCQQAQLFDTNIDIMGFARALALKHASVAEGEQLRIDSVANQQADMEKKKAAREEKRKANAAEKKSVRDAAAGGE